MATIALKKINRAQLERAADGLAAAVAASLPWSTSATSILLVLWLIVLIPTFRWSDLRREPILTTLAGGLPVLLWLLALLGMLWSDVGFPERLSGLAGYHKLLAIPLLLAQFRRSDRARWVIVGFFLASVGVLLVSWLPTIFPGLEGIAWRRGPGVVAKDYITQGSIFQLCVFALAYVPSMTGVMVVVDARSSLRASRCCSSETSSISRAVVPRSCLCRYLFYFLDFGFSAGVVSLRGSWQVRCWLGSPGPLPLTCVDS